MKKSVLSLICGVLLLTGCGGPQKDAEYGSINEFAAAYEDGLGGDIECRESSLDIQKNNWVSTTCGPHTILMMFTSDDKREEILSKNPLREGNRRVQGPNWVIEAAQYEAEDAQKALGGTLLDY